MHSDHCSIMSLPSKSFGDLSLCIGYKVHAQIAKHAFVLSPCLLVTIPYDTTEMDNQKRELANKYESETNKQNIKK